MKKTISVILLTALLAGILLTGPAYVSADNSIELKEALEIAKTAFDFDASNHDFSSSYSETKYGKRLWYLNWNSKDGGGSGISITVDAAEKEIINMYQWENTQVPAKRIPKHTREEALKVAEKLAYRLHPDKFKNTELMDKYQSELNTPYYISDSYNFDFIRKIDEIDFPDNLIQVQVDKNTLKVKSFRLDWDTVIPIPDSKKAISVDAARKIFEEKLGIELAYQMIYPSSGGDPKHILVYNQKDATRLIDAITGEIAAQRYYGAMKESALGGGSDAGGYYVPTPQEQKVIDATGKYISKEKAIELLKKYVPVDIKYTMNDSNLYSGQNLENAAWSFSWSYDDKENNTYSYIYGSVDAVTGEVKSFSISSSDNEQKPGSTPKFTKEQCRKIAEDFLKNIQPHKFNTSEYREQHYEIYRDQQNIPSYNMNYIRKENGVSVPSNNLNVTVSTYTGKITGFYMNWQSLDLPDTKDTISLSEAYRILYAKHNLVLKYARMYNYDKYNESTVIKLVYMPDNYYGMIDAKSGQFIDYSGNPVREDNKVSFTDIEGHKYENDIKLLAELRIIDSVESKYKPDLKIPQKEFVKLLIKATQPYYYPLPYTSGSDSEYDRYYENAITQNILAKKDKNPEACVTRMEASKMAVKALGIGFVADLENIFNLDFSDASGIAAENKGYASIAAALSLVDTTGNSFGPKHELTRAEAANMIIRYLNVEKTPIDSQIKANL